MPKILRQPRPRSTSKLGYVLPENKKDPHGKVAVMDADGENNKNHVPTENLSLWRVLNLVSSFCFWCTDIHGDARI